MNELAPIALFIYKRPELTRACLKNLSENPEFKNSILYVFADGPKPDAAEADIAKIERARAVVDECKWAKSTIFMKSEQNKGLANSIIEGVTKIVEKHGKIIVVEDDLLVSKYFLNYMNEGLRLYEREERVISIHGYVYPVKSKLPEVFFLKGADCWGWATWQRGWKLFEQDGNTLLSELNDRKLTKEFDFNGAIRYTSMLKDQIDGKNDSWAIRWYASAFLKNKLTLYPGKTLVQHVGIGEDATHMKGGKAEKVIFPIQPIKLRRIKISENNNVKSIITNYFLCKPEITISLHSRLKSLVYKKINNFVSKISTKLRLKT